MANNPTDKAKDLASTAGRAATDVKNKAQDLGASAYNQAKDTASQLADKARDAASAAGHRAGEAASFVGHRAEEATSSAGGGLRSLAGQVRQNAPREGMFGSAAGSVANALDSTGQYLQEEGLSGVAEDFTGLIRRNPIPALLIGVAVGFLFGQGYFVQELIMADRIQTTNSEPSAASLVSGIVADAQELIKQQLLLFKHELKDDVTKTKEALPTLGAGAALAMTTLILLGITLSLLLYWLVNPLPAGMGAEHLPLWGCFAIFTVVFGVVGCALLYFASKTIESLGMSRQAVKATEENLEWTTKPK